MSHSRHLHTLSLSSEQSRALSRLIRHLHAAWDDASAEEGSLEKGEEPFSSLELEVLLPLLRELDEDAEKKNRSES